MITISFVASSLLVAVIISVLFITLYNIHLLKEEKLEDNTDIKIIHK